MSITQEKKERNEHIKKQYEQGESVLALSQKYGLTEGRIRTIIKGRSQSSYTAITRYNDKNYDRIELKLKKESGLKQLLENHVATFNYSSRNEFLELAIKEKIERDKKGL